MDILGKNELREGEILYVIQFSSFFNEIDT